MIFFIFYSIKELMAILLIAIFAFSQALFLLSYQDTTLPYGDALQGIVNAFLYMMGDGDSIHSQVGFYYSY
jgi:hypothetical protein